MSKKPAAKDKKGESSQSFEAVVQQQKRQLLEQSFTIKQLQDRISRMTEQNHAIVSTRDEFQKKYEEKIDDQRIFLDSHNHTIEQLNQRVSNLEMIRVELEASVSSLQKQLQLAEEIRTREMDEYKRLTEAQKAILDNQLLEYNNYMRERDSLFEERDRLKSLLQNEKDDKIRELADKQREKVQETDKLKDQMLMKIRDMKNNLLSLKKDQLSTTTRLAVLQNHQLTSQLQFQSKQTEKLLLQNETLHKKLSNMQKDVQIHKQVEQQLAKRAHISKGIIKKLTDKIALLEQELRRVKDTEKITIDGKSSKKKQIDEEQNTKQEQLVSILDRTVEEKDRQIAKLQANCQALEAQVKNLKHRAKQTQKRSYQLSNMLLKYYEDVLNGKLQIKVNEGQADEFCLDIKQLKKKDSKQWENTETRLVITLLLNQLKTHISRHNLGIPTLNRSQIVAVNDQQSSSKLPTIGVSEHSLLKIDSRKFKQIPSALVPKLVGSNLREWGRSVHSNSVSNLHRRVK